VKKIQDITARISQMADEGEYGTKEYLSGKMMTDLRVERDGTGCERPDLDERYPLRSLRILIVDDDAGICQSLKDLLEAEGCQVETAASGVYAMQWLERRQFDLVLSDVVMPDIDGYQLYQYVKNKTPDLPVVLMTAFNYDKDHIIKRSCLEGLQGVVFKKPVNPVLLKKTLLQQCKLRRAYQQAPDGSPPPANSKNI
jgi:CheY-like chemotaxis protein